jgi:ketosteroid isomerase-like protein
VAAPAAPARASEPVATQAGARAVETTLPIKPATPAGPVASAAAPAATASPQPADASSDVRERVTHWVAAWSARDVDRYLAFYAKDFAPGGGLTRAAWEAQRRARLSGASSIQVAVRDVRIEAEGADRATVRFTQDYTSGSYRETGTRKRLVMRRDDGRWRIVSEGADA